MRTIAGLCFMALLAASMMALFPDESQSGCGPAKPQRIIIRLEGLDTIKFEISSPSQKAELTREELRQRMREVIDEINTTGEGWGELAELQRKYGWGDKVWDEESNTYYHQPLSQNRPPYNFFSYVIWCMLADQEHMAMGDAFVQ